MNYWITTDTHFGHDKLMEYLNRPKGFEDLILRRHQNTIKQGDVLIHLGDICIGNDKHWHAQFMKCLPSVKRWLIRGNHDKKTNHWYLNHGWDFVATTIQMRVYGLDILFSHIPQPDSGYDINIHGHSHNNDHHRHEPELKAVKSSKHRLVFLEHHYAPVNLRRLAMQPKNSPTR